MGLDRRCSEDRPVEERGSLSALVKMYDFYQILLSWLKWRCTRARLNEIGNWIFTKELTRLPIRRNLMHLEFVPLFSWKQAQVRLKTQYTQYFPCAMWKEKRLLWWLIVIIYLKLNQVTSTINNWTIFAQICSDCGFILCLWMDGWMKQDEDNYNCSNSSGSVRKSLQRCFELSWRWMLMLTS